MNTVNSVARKEPAVGIGASVTAILYAGYGILRAAGIAAPEEMITHVNALVLALCAIPAVTGFLTRFFVFSPDTTDRMSRGQDAAGTPPTNPQPALATRAETSDAGAI